MKNLNIFLLIVIFLTFSSCRKETNLDSGLFGSWTNQNNSTKKLSFSSNGKCSEWSISNPSYSDTFDWYVEGSYIHFSSGVTGGV